MKRSLFISLAFVLALVVMAGLSWQWYRNRIALIESDRWENHTYTVMVQLEELLLILTGAETEQRDFIITGSEEYLQPYNRALSMVGQKLASLRSLLQDNPAQQKRLDVIEPLAQAKLAELQQTIELRRTSGFGAASQVVEARRGKSLMDQIRQEVTQARAAEARLLKQRTLAKEAGLQTSFWTALVGGIMSGGLLLAAFLLLKREQAATRASEVRYRRLFEAAHDGVLLLDTHSQKITDANPFMTKLLGYPREELVGKELWQIGLRENSKTSRAAFERLVHEGQTRFEDLPLQTKTGTAREVEFVSNVYDEDGRSVVQCNIRDITQRKQAEEALRESEKRYRTLFEAMDEGFCIIEVLFDESQKPLDYRFLEINPAFEKHTELIAAQGKTMREIAPKHEAYWFEIYGKIALTGQPARFQNRAEQLHRWFDVYAFRFGRPEQRQVAILFTDITERRQAAEALRESEKRLQAANRELNDFATIVSHDLKSPLRAVATLAKWLQTDYADKLNDEGRDHLAEMVKRVSRMDRMIDDILQYSRLGRTAEKPEWVALAELVSGVVEDLAPPAHACVRIAPDLPAIFGEPVRLRQVFQNLIANALKYCDKPSVEVRVDWADSGAMWQFSVADNGPGIEERHFERIFKIFQTLAPKDKTDSTGVGLALVERIIERAGGRVWVESRLGEGSTFHFTWPKGARAGTIQTMERMAA